MKSNGIKFILSIILIVTFFVVLNTGFTFLDNNISRECEVECFVDGDVVFRDRDGNLWGWTLREKEYYSLGQKVILIMNTNNTKDIKDDFILKIKVDKKKNM